MGMWIALVHSYMRRSRWNTMSDTSEIVTSMASVSVVVSACAMRSVGLSPLTYAMLTCGRYGRES